MLRRWVTKKEGTVVVYVLACCATNTRSHCYFVPVDELLSSVSPPMNRTRLFFEQREDASVLNFQRAPCFNIYRHQHHTKCLLSSV